MGLPRGMCERFLGFYGVIHSRNAIKAARETNRQKAMRSPFLVGKGPGDRSFAQRHQNSNGDKPSKSHVLPPFLVGTGVAYNERSE